jgi:hypothetical protein
MTSTSGKIASCLNHDYGYGNEEGFYCVSGAWMWEGILF